MKRKLLHLCAIALLIVTASAAHAGCYADYKAKRDNPLRLHYGVIELPEPVCRTPARANAIIADLISADEWQLLSVVSVFGDDGLDERRKSAGKYFLRY